MDEHLIFDGRKYASSLSAAAKAGYTNDYVARLCRQGKIRGKMVGKTWYVEENSFLQYLVDANQKKEKRKKTLSVERREEYREAPKAIAPTPEASSAPAMPLVSPVAIAPAATPIKSPVVLSEDPWKTRARQVVAERKDQGFRPDRALAATLALALVVATPVIMQSIPRGLAVIGDSPIAVLSARAVSSAKHSDAGRAVAAAAVTEAAVVRQSKADIAFETNRTLRALSHLSVAPSGYYAAVLTAVSTSETFAVTVNIAEVKALWHTFVSKALGALEALLRS